MNSRLIGWVVITSLLNSTAVIAVRWGLIGGVSPLALALLRLLISLPPFALTLALRRTPLPRDARTWRDIFITALTGTAIPLIGGTTALQMLSTGVATVFVSLHPMVVGVMAHFWLDERLNWRRLVGLALGLAGVLVIVATGASGLAGQPMTGPLGPVLMIAVVLSAASSLIYTRLRLHDIDPVVNSAGQVTAALVMLAPLALVPGMFAAQRIGWQGWGAILYAGLVGIFVGFIAFFMMLRRFGATSSALNGYIIPVLTAALGALLLGEQITGAVVLGGGLALAGVFMSSR